MSRKTKEQEARELIKKCAFVVDSLNMIGELKGFTIQDSKMSNVVVVSMDKRLFDQFQREIKLKEQILAIFRAYNLDVEKNKGIVYILSDYIKHKVGTCHSVSSKMFFADLPLRYIGETVDPFDRFSFHREHKQKWWCSDNASIIFVFCKDNSIQDHIKSWIEREIFLSFHSMANCVLKNNCIPNGPKAPLTLTDEICAIKIRDEILKSLSIANPSLFDKKMETAIGDFEFLCALENPIKRNGLPAVIVGVEGINAFYLLKGSLLVNAKYSGNSNDINVRVDSERKRLHCEGAIKEVNIGNFDGNIPDYYAYECQRDIFFDKISSPGQFCKMAAVEGTKAFKVYRYPKIIDESFEKMIQEHATKQLKCLASDNNGLSNGENKTISEDSKDNNGNT